MKSKEVEKKNGRTEKSGEWGENYLIVILFWQITIQSSKAMNLNKKLLKQ